MNNKSIFATSSILLLIGLFVAINVVSDRVLPRLSVDLTEEGLYSLSDGTKKIISEFKEPTVIKLFLSSSEGSQYPLIKIYGNRVKDLLNQYRKKSKGLIDVEVYDPKQDTEEQEWAQKYGLTPLPLPTGGQLYFGMVALNSYGKEEVIPMFNIQRQEFLEYDITKLLYSLGRESKPIVGLISSLDLIPANNFPPQGVPRQARPEKWVFISQLEKVAKIVNIGTDVNEIPDEIEELIIVHPKDLSEKSLFSIDQFLMKGGRLFIAVDSYASVDQPAPNPQNPMASISYNRSSNMEKLFKAWGVTFNSDKVVGDMSIAAQVSTRPNSPPVRFPTWLLLGSNSGDKSDNVNRDSIITADLDNLVLPWAGTFKTEDVKGINKEVLFSTSKQAMHYSENTIRFSAQNPQELVKKYVPGIEKLTLGLKLSGKFNSAFTSGVEGRELIKESVTDGAIILMSDVDFISDRYSSVTQNLFGTKLVSLINDNIIFASNAVENLLGSDSLISLRSRGKFARPFTKVQAIELAAHEKWQTQEQNLQKKLTAANQRLAQLEAGKKDGNAIFSDALVQEVKKFRLERSDAQRKLREVRRKLREDKEGLGSILFALNTFLIPFLIIAASAFFVFRNNTGKSA